jgi:hypothetical protein
MQLTTPAETVETKVGDLIVALTEETNQYIGDEQEAYELVAYLLFDLTRRPSTLGKSVLR